jgi:hypothetical protein
MPRARALVPAVNRRTKPPPAAAADGLKAVAVFRRSDSSTPTCFLGAGELCGGVSFCGADRDCPAKGCCTVPLGCRHGSPEVWRCQ